MTGSSLQRKASTWLTVGWAAMAPSLVQVRAPQPAAKRIKSPTTKGRWLRGTKVWNIFQSMSMARTPCRKPRREGVPGASGLGGLHLEPRNHADLAEHRVPGALL
eukprot:CAMPEP_0181286902 /NCGR_PEP_ID=MMETSP1097-20121128/16856_1 /TAXON_ID=35684 /ORGANISM="Pseudopedinella elastica, Strain CCMP716" /LENGTH=104 /DNA_ID=CAMNT_0023390777 /DNA_START=232 /DNA_END=543 /DNA_ORIENTATION=-